MIFKRELAASKATAAGLAILGVFWGGFAPFLPEYQARLRVEDAALGRILLASAAGGMVGMALAPRLTTALGARWGRWEMLPLGVACALVALLPLAATGGFGTANPLGFGCALLAMGLAMASLDMAANLRISAVEGTTGLHLMNLNHAIFSLSFATAALVTGIARHQGAAPEQVVPLLSLVMAGLSGLMGAPDAMPQAQVASSQVTSAQANPAQRRVQTPWALVGAGALILFAPFVSENAVESWSTFHFERNLGVATGEGALGPVMFGVMMGLGRLGGQALAARLGVGRLLAYSAVMGTAGGLVVAWATSVWLAAIGIALIGLGAAVIVPSASSLIGHAAPPEARAIALSRAWMLAFTGFFLGPVAMGLIAGSIGLRWGFVMIAALMASALIGLALVQRYSAAAQNDSRA